VIRDTLRQLYEFRFLVSDDLLKSLLLALRVRDARIVVIEHEVRDF
jgi:hypothetical protein